MSNSESTQVIFEETITIKLLATHIIINVKKIVQLEYILSLIKHQLNVFYMQQKILNIIMNKKLGLPLYHISHILGYHIYFEKKKFKVEK